MKYDQSLDRLKRYEADLKGIHSRFRRTRESIHIGEGDDARFHQVVIELRDLLDDLLGKNSYSSMIVAAFNEGVSNWLQSPSLKSVERVLGIVSAAITRVQENPSLLDQTSRTTPPQPIATQDRLTVPDKVTLHWLYKNVPYSFWLWFVGIVVAAFIAGATAAAKLSIVQQWFGIEYG